MVKQLCDAEMTTPLKAHVLSGAVPSNFVITLPRMTMNLLPSILEAQIWDWPGGMARILLTFPTFS